jgi:hypothetical protein
MLKSFSFFLLLSFLNTPGALAAPSSGLDYKAGASGQTYPLGGLLTGTLGYGVEMWKGQGPDTGSDFWQYGYLRPVLEWKTAAVTNRLTAAVEVFPISILGVSAGGGIDQRNYKKFTSFDCDSVMCDQSLSFQFVQARLIVGAGKFLGVITGRYDWYRAESDKQAFYDYMSYLIGQPGHDNLRTLNVVALYRHDETWGFGALAIYQQMIYSQNNSASMFGIVNYTEGPWRGTVGLGEFHSSHQAEKPSMVFSLEYHPVKGIGLLD